MEIVTSRFGVLRVHPDDVLTFPAGIVGLAECRRWVLVPDSSHEALAWLQSVTRPEVALPVVSPRRFVADYQLRLSQREMAPLELAAAGDAEVLTVVVRNGEVLTLNLKAPIVLNLRARIGRQVVCAGNQPTQHVLLPKATVLRRAA
jgi:flagellar assembly factor FliW